MSYDSAGIMSNFILEWTTLLTAISFNACCILTVMFSLFWISSNHCFSVLCFDNHWQSLAATVWGVLQIKPTQPAFGVLHYSYILTYNRVINQLSIYTYLSTITCWKIHGLFDVKMFGDAVWIVTTYIVMAVFCLATRSEQTLLSYALVTCFISHVTTALARYM